MSKQCPKHKATILDLCPACTADAAIAAFAKRLTEGSEWTACRMCSFSRMESAANPEEYSCSLTDAPCPIRQAANLPNEVKA